MIAVYLLSFTILITSVIKVAGTFIELDKNLTAKRAQFIQQTKSLHKNQDGSITLMAILLTLMISALLMFFTLKNKVELKEARYRKDSYLCFKFLNIETENYIKDMSKFNIALRTSYAAQFAPVPAAAAAAKTLFEAIIVARNARHFFYIKNLLKNEYCEGQADSISYIKNFPYDINVTFILQTNIDQTTKLKAHQWTVTHYKHPSGIRFKNSFCLEADMQADGAFIPRFKIKTSELSTTVFSKSKCFFGFP
ncbi:MAG: hypothetical protein H7336_14540 [Bacteriovorax sp.]|nr:hypothetical protein [Bacteriovorax sp.]